MKNTIKAALELVSKAYQNPGSQLTSILEIMVVANDDSVWEREFDENVSLIIDNKGVKLSVMIEGVEHTFGLAHCEEYGILFIDEPGYDILDFTDKSPQELVVAKLSGALRGRTVSVNEYWEIECGDNGWMRFDADLNCYIIGAYGRFRPFTELNTLEGYADCRPGEMVLIEDEYKAVEL